MSEKTLIALVQKELHARANAGKAKEMQAYMRTEMPFYGVQKPERTPIYRQVASEFCPASPAEYEKYVLALWNLPHREEKYIALDYACRFKSMITPERMPLFRKLIEEGAWWDFVDVVAVNLVGQILLQNREKTKKLIDLWGDDDDMWIRRTSIICHNHHKEQTDHRQLFSTCTRLMPEKEFFIRKAIGWALREYSYHAPDAVIDFVTKNESALSPLSYREAVKALVRNGKFRIARR